MRCPAWAKQQVPWHLGDVPLSVAAETEQSPGHAEMNKAIHHVQAFQTEADVIQKSLLYYFSKTPYTYHIS